MNTYTLLQFIPNHILDTRITFAAAVHLGGDAVAIELVDANQMPGPNSIGGPAAAALLSTLRDGVLKVGRLDHIRAELGPHAALGPTRSIPITVPDSRAWVRDCVLGALSPPATG